MKEYMHKYYQAVLYSVLFLVLLCIGGCQLLHFAGGGFHSHMPPEKIICDKPWTVTISFCITMPDPKEKYGKLAGRWKDVTIHIRNSSDSNLVAVPMVLQSADPKTGYSVFSADMKPIPCDPNVKYVEYYEDGRFDNCFSGTRLYRVPVSKN
jgi:hypothetical protein